MARDYKTCMSFVLKKKKGKKRKNNYPLMIVSERKTKNKKEIFVI